MHEIKRTRILETEEGVVTLADDNQTESYSIGLRTANKLEWKFISKELHDKLVQELSNQEGNRIG